MKISDLSKLITTHRDYDDDFSKNKLTLIIEDRKLREQQGFENRKLREEQEFEKEKERLDCKFQLEKLWLENERLKELTSTPEAKNVGHLARECPKNTRKTPPRNARSNTITAKGTELESTKEVVTARVSIPVSVPINTRNGIDDLQFVDIKCG
ncbi:hypothetical protein TNCT_410721 [Trichonephila clavata]|uniref:Uncharacterized protein n=1 Tax=Trichonephila clavata TaxID=2740835 RepID=A0A8X6KYG6_TRICU|nr:hypothetical protein TNCT_410721 [Trichonephila clavata]